MATAAASSVHAQQSVIADPAVSGVVLTPSVMSAAALPSTQPSAQPPQLATAQPGHNARSPYFSVSVELKHGKRVLKEWSVWESWMIAIETARAGLVGAGSGSILDVFLNRAVVTEARLCLFHVKKAFVERLRRAVSKDKAHWAAIFQQLHEMVYAATQEKFEAEWAALKRG